MAAIFPAMWYEDAPAAIDWLCRAFGFQQRMVMPDDTGKIAHAELQLDNVAIMLGSARPSELPMVLPKDAGGCTQCIYVYLPEVEAHYERAVAAGAEIVRPLDDTPYGSREYCCRDLEGYLWSFGTYDPFAPPAGQ